MANQEYWLFIIAIPVACISWTVTKEELFKEPRAISGFSIVWVANVYMSLYNLIRIDLKKEKIIARKEEDSIKAPNPEQNS